MMTLGAELSANPACKRTPTLFEPPAGHGKVNWRTRAQAGPVPDWPHGHGLLTHDSRPASS